MNNHMATRLENALSSQQYCNLSKYLHGALALVADVGLASLL
jgi:hypothetical protein